MIQRLFLVLMLTPAFLSVQNPSALPADLTLKQALDIAFQNSSILREARGNLEKASGTYEQSRSVLLPQVNIFAHQGYLTLNLPGLGILIPGQPNLIGPFSSMDARAILTQDLVNIAGIRSWKSFSSHRDAASLLVENAREVVALNVVSAYLQALSAKSNRDALSEQTKLANELY